MVDPDAGYIQRDGLLLACEVVDCQPWFDFADLEVFVSDSEAESLSTDPEEILDSEDSDALTPEEEDTFRQSFTFSAIKNTWKICRSFGCKSLQLRMSQAHQGLQLSPSSLLNFWNDQGCKILGGASLWLDLPTLCQLGSCTHFTGVQEPSWRRWTACGGC